MGKKLCNRCKINKDINGKCDRCEKLFRYISKLDLLRAYPTLLPLYFISKKDTKYFNEFSLYKSNENNNDTEHYNENRTIKYKCEICNRFELVCKNKTKKTICFICLENYSNNWRKYRDLSKTYFNELKYYLLSSLNNIIIDYLIDDLSYFISDIINIQRDYFMFALIWEISPCYLFPHINYTENEIYHIFLHILRIERVNSFKKSKKKKPYTIKEESLINPISLYRKENYLYPFGDCGMKYIVPYPRIGEY